SSKLRMSPSKFLANTVLPAPMNAMRGMMTISPGDGSYSLLDRSIKAQVRRERLRVRVALI
ncbi:MAG: hypothetical protein PHC78_03935, partial [Verrucomicrobiota bacterium]|nr:hypothetical protein [Verrucomicrobiota bacterium]